MRRHVALVRRRSATAMSSAFAGARGSDASLPPVALVVVCAAADGSSRDRPAAAVLRRAPRRARTRVLQRPCSPSPPARLTAVWIGTK